MNEKIRDPANSTSSPTASSVAELTAPVQSQFEYAVDGAKRGLKVYETAIPPTSAWTKWRKSWLPASFACAATNQQTIPMTSEKFHWTSPATGASMVPTRDKAEKPHEHPQANSGIE